ncbi:MAG: 30S ribosomal protein S17e [Candidatus Aenigmatarchaeota archaeon]|nr:MAG: 30S ribosomal protein S17e [Candidatus Aenigmarchaeota archaeon]
MGRIKNAQIKKLAHDLLTQHSDKFTTDFEKNKQALNSIMEFKSKKVRNVIAGYITKEMKRLQKTGL